MAESFMWTCPACQKDYSIQEGRTPPNQCPACDKKAFVVDVGPRHVVDVGPRHVVGDPLTSRVTAVKKGERSRNHSEKNIVATLLILIGIGAILVGILMAVFSLKSEMMDEIRWFLAVCWFGSGMLSGVLLFALSAIMLLLIDIEQNTRKS